jgi:hypothetical protein
LGAELHQRPHAARGALLQFECRRKTRGVQALGAHHGLMTRHALDLQGGAACPQRPPHTPRAARHSLRSLQAAGGGTPPRRQSVRLQVAHRRLSECFRCARGEPTDLASPLISPPPPLPSVLYLQHHQLFAYHQLLSHALRTLPPPPPASTFGPAAPATGPTSAFSVNFAPSTPVRAFAFDLLTSNCKGGFATRAKHRSGALEK